ncbi:hypothetical protein E4K10_46030 [Streptomyces sp. T1317-0309]|nr:hypothetical protein E4K10_46030 [Streptomyces sp. T1317-0309]
MTTDLDKLWRSYQNSIVFDALQADAMIDAEYRNADNASGALAKEVADVKKDLHEKAQGALKESADRFRGDSRDMLVKAVRDKENFAEFSDNFMEANKESILKALQEVACKKANQGWDTRGSLASMTYVNCMKKGISNGDRLNFDKYEAEMHETCRRISTSSRREGLFPCSLVPRRQWGCWKT